MTFRFQVLLTLLILVGTLVECVNIEQRRLFVETVIKVYLIELLDTSARLFYMRKL